MRYVYAGSACVIQSQLQPLPDAGNVTWTLRNNAGAVTSTGFVVVDGNSFLASVPISGGLNAKTLPTESRFVTFAWHSSATAYELTVPYVLIDFLPLRTTPDNVRAYVGANRAELPDADIDIPSSASLVRVDIGPTIFDAAIVAGDTTTDLLARMVALWSAASFYTSLPLRIVESMSNDQAKFARSKSLDIDKLIQNLRGEYERMRNVLQGIDDAHVTNPTLFTTSKAPIDTIRGPLIWSNFPPWSPFFRP